MRSIPERSSYLKSVVAGYLRSAEYHDRRAQISDAEGDDHTAAIDRGKAAEYRKRARQLERQVKDAA